MNRKIFIMSLFLIDAFSAIKCASSEDTPSPTTPKHTINSDEEFSASTARRPSETAEKFTERMIFLKSICDPRYNEQIDKIISDSEPTAKWAEEANPRLREVLTGPTWRHPQEGHRPDTCI